jgi:hypothetical protein
MQFKKLAAITGSALMAGLSLVGPALATSVTAIGNIADLVSVTDSTVSFPMFVVGATALPADIAGAIGVAVNMASNAKTTAQVAVEGVSVGITGGATMATPTNPLVMWDNLASSKQVLTATDLPEVLVAGTYVDQASVSVGYSQYLTFTNAAANGQIVYSTPQSGTSPELGLQIDAGSAVYTYLLSFTQQVSEAVSGSSATNMVNSQLNILGKTWTITGATVGTHSLTLTMLSGKNAQTVTTEEPATYDVDGSTYTVTLVAVGSIGSATVNAVTITVEGGGLAAPETLQILTGGSKPLSDGTLVGVTSIFATTKTGAIDSAVVFLGADKLELTNANITDASAELGVKVNGVTQNDVTVQMAGTTPTNLLTLDNIQIVWTPTQEKFVSQGTSLTDPASKGFKVFFGGITPALDDTANRETVTVTPAGTLASLAYTTADGQSLSQAFGKATGLSTMTLTDAGNNAIHLVEGETAGINDYVLVGQNNLAGSAQNPFGHMLRVLSLQTTSTTTSSLQDVASGSTLTITGGNTTLYLDGQAYQVCVLSSSAVQITWGTNAAACDVGSNTYDVYPAIMTSKGSWVAITNPVNITGLANQTTYTIQLPTGSIDVQPHSYVSANDTSAGTATYEIKVGNATATDSWIAIKATDNQGTPGVWSTPGVMVVQGLDEDQVRNLIAVRVMGGATVLRAEIAAPPSFTGSVTGSDSIVSGTTLNRYVNEYGAYVTYDSTLPSTFSASLPSTQALATVGVGKSPAPSAGGGAGSVTTETVLPITADVVKLDSEITSSDKTNYDLVLMGGPCVDSLVEELYDLGLFPYSCVDADGMWPGRDFGRVDVITDAFATGKTALVIAGTRPQDTDLAARIVQTGFPGATDAQKAEASIEITGSVSSPAYA